MSPDPANFWPALSNFGLAGIMAGVFVWFVYYTVTWMREDMKQGRGDYLAALAAKDAAFLLALTAKDVVLNVSRTDYLAALDKKDAVIKSLEGKIEELIQEIRRDRLQAARLQMSRRPRFGPPQKEGQDNA